MKHETLVQFWVGDGPELYIDLWTSIKLALARRLMFIKKGSSFKSGNLFLSLYSKISLEEFIKLKSMLEWLSWLFISVING